MHTANRKRQQSRFLPTLVACIPCFTYPYTKLMKNKMPSSDMRFGHVFNKRVTETGIYSCRELYFATPSYFNDGHPTDSGRHYFSNRSSQEKITKTLALRCLTRLNCSSEQSLKKYTISTLM